MSQCIPTIRGEIKKARTGNYDISSSIFEFIDNSIDAGAKRIRIDIRQRSGTGLPHKIIISDNASHGISEHNIQSIFSWTYERKRELYDIGEYGTGFKTASVNISDKLTLMTMDHDKKCFQATADWQDMAIDNRWDPQIMPIQHEYYKSIHPYKCGTTFVLESLRNEMFTLRGNEMTVTSILQQLFDDVCYYYHYILLKDPELDITIRGLWSPSAETEEKHVRGVEPLYFFTDDPSSTKESLSTDICVFQDVSRFYHVVFQTPISKKWERVEYIDRRKNGNSIVKIHEITFPTNMRLMDRIIFRSSHETDPLKSSRMMDRYISCTMDVMRNGRIVGKEVVLRAPRTDPLLFFVKHELWYNNYELNHIIGIQYNKKSSGTLRDSDLRYTLEHVQYVHEREIWKYEKVHQSARKSNEIPISENHASPPPPPISVVQDSVAVTPKSDMCRRKNFTPQVKIHTLHKQECRDSVLDFVLKDDILMMDYDHKDGVPSTNTPENCQALSVITHALKTRCPSVYETLERGDASEISKQKMIYIVQLLNSITRSKYFIEGILSDQIRVRHGHQLSTIQEGIFEYTSS